jgi:uncharacterized protein (TIGR03000 family)
MRRWLVLSVLGLAGLVGAAGRADAMGVFIYRGPYPQTVAFPCLGAQYYTNTYYYAWQYPWYAYYNYSHGPYANWAQGGGFATYAGGCQNGLCGGGLAGYTGNAWYGYSVQYRYQPLPGYPTYGYPYDYPGMPVAPSLLSDAGKPSAGTVTVTLPADAQLRFNGAAVTGTGATRTFLTPPLETGREYSYELTAEVVRGGERQTLTGRVVVRAGETATATLESPAVRAAAK